MSKNKSTSVNGGSPSSSDKSISSSIDRVGCWLIEAFHVIGLFVVGMTIIWSAVGEYIQMMNNSTGYATLKDILLLFIYLELGAMTGIYFKTHKMPVVFLIFIAITAITRYLVIDMKELVSDGDLTLLLMVLSIAVLAVAAGVLKYIDKNFSEEEY